MMIETQISNHLWTKEVKIMVCILNRCPTKSNNKITSKELFFGIKPYLDHLRVFGCKSYVHILKEKRKKLSPKAFERIMARYDENSKAYKIYDPRHRKIVISIDVKFDELSCFSYKLIPLELLSLEVFYNHPTSASIDLKKVQPNLSPHA